jgi:photosystem II stability/assembly factor-like uncharacterized protein
MAGRATGSLYKTVDGGKKWEMTELPKDGIGVTHVYFASRDEGWIITDDKKQDTKMMYHTIDGGNTWRELKADEITRGFKDDTEENLIPLRWAAGRLFQMIYAAGQTRL